jgi:hypothetical protein
MKKTLFSVLASGALLLSSASAVACESEARELYKLMGTEEIEKAMEEAMIAEMPSEQRAMFKSQMGRESEYMQQTRDASIRAMADTFSCDEIKAWKEFHLSPVGKSITKKMPAYTMAVMKETQKIAMKQAMEGGAMFGMPGAEEGQMSPEDQQMMQEMMQQMMDQMQQGR